MEPSEPLFNVPRAVLYSMLLMVAVQAIRVMLPDETDLIMLLSLAFIPARYSGEAGILPGGYVAAVTSFVTYMIVHGGWVHLLVNMLWMLAFGSAVARRIGSSRFLYFSILAGIAGALTHLAFHWGEQAPVVGASAAISGQMAAAIRFVFRAGPQTYALAGQRDWSAVPLASLGQTLSDPRILLFLGIWVVINIAFGLSTPISGVSSGGVAWEAHIGGFLFGLLAFGWFDRPTPKPDAATV
ncbi:rhomboid family intramembrane serine protease [Methyloligella sp. 2.7D]|uniref:rhomboid family intramembrane serine protease n=1 Tax=unclassified Methyloligella TaxID=2625955 RepID=UPI00157DA131|nr:rhomboid family intramembrane serine protease [Methyloligella sp. GL2]QKP77305.1 rhomboid family intramembrane serine protease [Methyloligella sp. GL2]